MHPEEIRSRLMQLDASFQLELLENIHPAGFKVHPDQLLRVCTALKDDERLFFDMLSSISAVDLGPDAQSIELIYHLYAITNEVSLSVKVILDRQQPEVDSVCSIWRAADWHEREAFDLMGVKFKGHPDLRRILLPNDWEGHPLRKDYQEQEKYHGITVVYDRDE